MDIYKIKNELWVIEKWVNSQSKVKILPTLGLIHASGWKIYFSINNLGFVSSESVPQVKIQVHMFTWKRNPGNSDRSEEARQTKKDRL